jgi:hypothetical protein
MQRQKATQRTYRHAGHRGRTLGVGMAELAPRCGGGGGTHGPTVHIDRNIHDGSYVVNVCAPLRRCCCSCPQTRNVANFGAAARFDAAAIAPAIPAPLALTAREAYCLQTCPQTCLQTASCQLGCVRRVRNWAATAVVGFTGRGGGLGCSFDSGLMAVASGRGGGNIWGYSGGGLK